jgi:arylsulfatase A-like enzyme
MAKSDKPNILIIWGDDIGYWNISRYSMGMMGYQTPNIDRIGAEGATFTDWYGQQSCTAGRACFITGQNPIRTGLTKVGMPGATIGLHAEDPTIAEMLKPLGYATGQFGKNHLGDRDEYLPTVHGFDEFFGNLYHLNAEEEPELPDYPKDPAFKKKFGPRGVLHCLADGKGGQKITDTGPLTKKRMETIDEEITAGALAWMEKQAKAEQPFFLWYNSTAMHFRTHLADKNRGKSGQDDYSDRMVTHDEQVGELLKKLDELGIADNTIVMYSTDNGPENDTWPDGANTPFRSQKDTNWEGGWRVPLDGYNMIPYVTGAVKESPRNAIMYFSDDGEVMAVRVGDYKFNLAVQRATRMMQWAEPLVKLRLPLIFNLRRDPFERADINSNTYFDWMVDHVPQLYLMQATVAAQIENFVKFPPRQKPASFNLDAVLAMVSTHGAHA